MPRTILILFITLAALGGIATALLRAPRPRAPLQPQPYPPTEITSQQVTRASWWIPNVGATFQWQLSTPVDLSIDAEVYDIDLFDNSAEVIAALHTEGRRVICYISVGTVENWRSDQGEFDARVIGKEYAGWEGERWLDIRRIDLLEPIMTKRFDLAQKKGCDALEPDNIDAYDNDTGFPLTAVDQLTYNRWLADQAHARGLSIGLKNDPDLVAELVPSFDWALTEDCSVDEWCAQMIPFVQAGKAVFQVEYTDQGVRLSDFCPQARQNQFTGILKRRELDSWREVC